MQHVPCKIYLFESFTLNLERACLMRDGQEIKLRPKSFDVLRYLVENRGRLVSKDELVQAVWRDSFVTDDSPVQCVRDIRQALDDDTQHYIKTVPRRGYIFEAEVIDNDTGTKATIHTKQDERPRVVGRDEEQAIEAANFPAGRLVYAQPALAQRLWPWPWIGVVVLIAVVGFVALYFWPRGAPPIWQAVPLTSYPGFECNPALSPDGNQVAFTWNGEKQDNFDIYIKLIGSSPPLRLTMNPAEDVSPAWSPDGRTIAFLRGLGRDRNELLLIPALGGPERKLTETRSQTHSDFQLRRLAWSPDGRWIATSHRERDDAGDGLFLVSALTGHKRRLTQPPRGNLGDYTPAFSRDGRGVAFSRHQGETASEVYLQQLGGDFEPAGEAKPLTTEGRRAVDPVWTSDGSDILYVLRFGGSRRELRRIAASGSGTSEQVPLLDDDIHELSLGRHLVYSRRTGDNNIWRAEIPPAGGPASRPQLLISSTHHDFQPRYSPDGKKIAFGSLRSGTREIWISDADGSNAVQRTFFGGAVVGFMNWSPDGQQLVFHARPQGQADLFTIPAAGGPPKRLTTDPSDDSLPSYSHDGRWIYFTSTRSGQGQIWKIPAEGGNATQITQRGGGLAWESDDGETLYYYHYRAPEKGIWKVPVQGGEEMQVTGPVSNPAGFAVTPEGIYYTAAPVRPNQHLIQFFNFSTGQNRPVVVADRQIGLGLSLSPDHRFLVFAQRDQTGSDLMVIENFVAQ